MYFFLFRDIFLDGAPLSAYNKIKNTTKSKKGWEVQWNMYWLPALISKGLVKRSSEFVKTTVKTSGVFKYVMAKTGKHDTNETVDVPSSIDENFIKLAQSMIKFGKHRGLLVALKFGYSEPKQFKLKHKFRHAWFTMVDFLEHVLWTRDLNLPDPYWNPISDVCNPCGGERFKYVLHVENPEETSCLLSFLEGGKEKTFKEHPPTRVKSDKQYFENVPTDLMYRIRDMYRMDFILFGYDENNF